MLKAAEGLTMQLDKFGVVGSKCNTVAMQNCLITNDKDSHFEEPEDLSVDNLRHQGAWGICVVPNNCQPDFDTMTPLQK